MNGQHDPLHLPPGARLLNGQYTIVEVLGQVGFGITYRVSQHGVPFARAVKECFPDELAERRDGMIVPRTARMAPLLTLCLKTFQNEVNHLARLSHPGIVPVMQVFPENGTVYMVQDYIAGPTLEAYAAERGNTLPQADILRVLHPILDALEMLHGEGILHRDIAPDNILIRADGLPVLIDFGAARQAILEKSRHTSGLRSVKDGYSPHELYVQGTRQGPQSDLYSLAATLHRLVTGQPPPPAELRAHALASAEPDPYLPLAGRWPDYDGVLLGLIDSGLSHRFAARPADAASWRDRLAPQPLAAPTGTKPPPPAPDKVLPVAQTQSVRTSSRSKTMRAASMAGVLAVALTGLGAALYRSHNPPTPDDALLSQPDAPSTPDADATPPPVAPEVAGSTPPAPGPEADDTEVILVPAEEPQEAAPDPAPVPMPVAAPADASPEATPPPAPSFTGTQSELVQGLQRGLALQPLRSGARRRQFRAAQQQGADPVQSCGATLV